MTTSNGRYVPVFPLPNVVLYPRILLPLHIFEPRYRMMLTEVLDTYGKIAIALMKDPEGAKSDEPPEAHGIMGLGHVMTYETRPDGTSNIFLLGESRVRVEDLDNGTHYRRARFEILEDVPPPSKKRRDTLRASLKKWLDRLTKDWGKSDDLLRLKRVFSSQKDVGFLVDFLAHHFVDEPGDKQSLLELVEVENRARRLRSVLESRWT